MLHKLHTGTECVGTSAAQCDCERCVFGGLTLPSGAAVCHLQGTAPSEKGPPQQQNRLMVAI